MSPVKDQYQQRGHRSDHHKIDEDNNQCYNMPMFYAFGSLTG
jgi:hypothetical protein